MGVEIGTTNADNMVALADMAKQQANDDGRRDYCHVYKHNDALCEIELQKTMLERKRNERRTTRRLYEDLTHVAISEIADCTRRIGYLDDAADALRKLG